MNKQAAWFFAHSLAWAVSAPMMGAQVGILFGLIAASAAGALLYLGLITMNRKP